MDKNIVEELRDEITNLVTELVLNDTKVQFLAGQATNLVLGYDTYQDRDEDVAYWSTISTVISQALSLASVRMTYLRPSIK